MINENQFHEFDENHFQKFILKRRVAVVHFSHHEVMDHKVQFPDDLNHALMTWESEPRSCCALWPSHNMDLPGSVGVIYRPRLEHVLSVYNTDSGSSYHHGQEGSLGEDPSEDSLARSLDEVPTDEYNEWRLRGAPPMGIFVADTSHICVKQWVTPNVPEELVSTENNPVLCRVPFRLDGVLAAFPNHCIYTLDKEGLVLVRCRDSGLTRPCT